MPVDDRAAHPPSRGPWDDAREASGTLGGSFRLFNEFVQDGRATGTFPNPDHLAGYMELCLSAGLGLMLAQFGGEQAVQRSTWQRSLRTALAFLMSGKMLLRMTLVLLVIALVMTHSRMGNGAFFFRCCWWAPW